MKLVHTEGAKKRAQRLLKARSWSYRSRVPVAKWSETSFDISSRVCLVRRKISARRVCSIAGRRVFSWRLLLDIPKLCRGRIFQRWRRRMRRVWRGAVAGLRWSGAEGWVAAARLSGRRAVVDYFHRSKARQVGHARVGACQLDRCRRRGRRGRRRQTNEAV